MDKKANLLISTKTFNTISNFALGFMLLFALILGLEEVTALLNCHSIEINTASIRFITERAIELYFDFIEIIVKSVLYIVSWIVNTIINIFTGLG